MAIFSRRTLQRLINENANFLTEEQTYTHVKKLNKGDLSAEWEVVLLNAFNKLGKVIHEPEIVGSKKKIDILFSFQNIEFLADIVTVSDSFPEQENPVEYLEKKLLQIKFKKNLPGGFGFHILGNTSQVVFLKKKQELFIPKKKDFDRKVFNKDFNAFVNEITVNPHQTREFFLVENGINLQIVYSLSKIAHSSYPSFKEILSLENNSIWKNLKRKYDQLKETKYKGQIGIILCDGDCWSLRNTSPSWYAKSLRDVIHHFLRKKNKVGFIIIIRISQSLKVVCDIYKGMSFDDKTESIFSDLLKKTDDLFPVPVSDAMNASNSIQGNLINEGKSFHGGGHIMGDEIKVSPRTILDLLAGKINHEEFPNFYKDFFQKKLTEGKLIEEMVINKEFERDDDWLIIKFGKPDSAISPFKIPHIKE